MIFLYFLYRISILCFQMINQIQAFLYFCKLLSIKFHGINITGKFSVKIIQQRINGLQLLC